MPENLFADRNNIADIITQLKPERHKLHDIEALIHPEDRELLTDYLATEYGKAYSSTVWDSIIDYLRVASVIAELWPEQRATALRTFNAGELLERLRECLGNFSGYSNQEILGMTAMILVAFPELSERIGHSTNGYLTIDGDRTRIKLTLPNLSTIDWFEYAFYLKILVPNFDISTKLEDAHKEVLKFGMSPQDFRLHTNLRLLLPEQYNTTLDSHNFEALASRLAMYREDAQIDERRAPDLAETLHFANVLTADKVETGYHFVRITQNQSSETEEKPMPILRSY